MDESSPLTVAGAAPDWPENGRTEFPLSPGPNRPREPRHPYLGGDSAPGRNSCESPPSGCAANQGQSHNTGGRTTSASPPTTFRQAATTEGSAILCAGCSESG